MKGNDKDVSMNIGFSSDMILGGLRKNSDSKPEASPMKTLRSWLQSLEKANFDIKSLEFACHSVTPSVAKDSAIICTSCSSTHKYDPATFINLASHIPYIPHSIAYTGYIPCTPYIHYIYPTP